MINFPEQSIEQLIADMTLAEKIGRMTQVDKGTTTPADVADYNVGSVLSGGGGNPPSNSPGAWAEMVNAYLDAGSATRLGIPLLYGADAASEASHAYIVRRP